MPKPTDAIPRDIMNGETLKKATPMPLHTPIAVPAPIPAKKPTAIASQTASGAAAWTPAIARAPTTEVRARIVPTERSKPPVTSASIWPSETMVR